MEQSFLKPIKTLKDDLGSSPVGEQLCEACSEGQWRPLELNGSTVDGGGEGTIHFKIWTNFKNRQ